MGWVYRKLLTKTTNTKFILTLFELSGKQFMECYKQANHWTLNKNGGSILHDAFQLYELILIGFRWYRHHYWRNSGIIGKFINASGKKFTRQFKSPFYRCWCSYLEEFMIRVSLFLKAVWCHQTHHLYAFWRVLMAYDQNLHDDYKNISCFLWSRSL